MKSNLPLAILSTVLALPAVASAGSPAQRYRVTEIMNPPSATANCLPQYAIRVRARSINDFGLAAANLQCFSAVFPETVTTDLHIRAVLWAPLLGSFELPPADGASDSFAVSVNNRGDTFGTTFGTVTRNARWTLGGGFTHPFTGFGCSNGDLDFAVAGNVRGYVVGLAIRPMPGALPPLDRSCTNVGWVIRRPNGEQFYGPMPGDPTAVNALDVAVGNSGRAAIALHLPSGTQTVLNPGDASHSAKATDINDAGDSVGYVHAGECTDSTAYRWERGGREVELAKLPGANSARPAAAGYDGSTVGESGGGRYCNETDELSNHSVVWHGAQPFDLNALIPARLGITLIASADINRWGQILVTGYHDDAPMKPCPGLLFNPETGTFGLDMSPRCHDLRVFVLTPQRPN